MNTNGLLILALGVAGTVISILWWRRVFNVDPETYSFRATAPAPPNWLVRAGIALGFVAFGLALVAIALPR